jgi:hypothetical protein
LDALFGGVEEDAVPEGFGVIDVTESALGVVGVELGEDAG